MKRYERAALSGSVAVLCIGVFAACGGNTTTLGAADVTSGEVDETQALVSAKAACSRLTTVDWNKQSLNDNKALVPEVTPDLLAASSADPAKWGQLGTVATDLKAYVNAMESGIALFVLGLSEDDKARTQSGIDAQDAADKDFDRIKATIATTCSQIGSGE